MKEALERFREAVRIDPQNDDAKYNLELLMRLQQEGSAPGSGDGEDDSSGDGDDGSSGDPGDGY